jgi:hypothetical protein
VSDIAGEIEKIFGNDIEVRYVDILMDPAGVDYQEVVTEALSGLTDLPVVYIDGERRFAGGVTTDKLKAELINMGVSPK